MQMNRVLQFTKAFFPLKPVGVGRFANRLCWVLVLSIFMLAQPVSAALTIKTTANTSSLISPLQLDAQRVSVVRVQSSEYKSRREVIADVERSYNAKVLKISLNRSAEVYVVRILEPGGRVRTIRVPARR